MTNKFFYDIIIANKSLGDDMERKILHVDVNNAFLSWTAVDMLRKGSSLDIRTIPSIICKKEMQPITSL